jgi:phosphatidylinositol alpha 1,6-mannosyltransferase
VIRTEQRLNASCDRWRRLRIAMVVTWPPGAGRVFPHPSHDLMAQLRARGHEVVLVPLGTVRGFRSRAATRRRLARLLADSRPDLVYVAARPSLGLLAAEAARNMGVPVVAVALTACDLGDDARRPGAGTETERTFYASADRILAPSAAALQRLDEMKIHRAFLWPRAVNTSVYRPERATSRLRPRASEAGALMVGYVHRGLRGTQLLIPPRLSGASDMRFVAIGIQNGGELPDVLASMDVLLDPGTYGDSGEELLAAMASGVPVVAPGIGEARDVVTHGRTGWLCAPGDAAELTYRLRLLAQAPALRARMGERARNTALDRDWSLMSERLLEHCGDLVAPEAIFGPKGMTTSIGAWDSDAVGV